MMVIYAIIQRLCYGEDVLYYILRRQSETFERRGNLLLSGTIE